MPDNVTERHRNLTQRVSILGDISVSEQAVSLLAKGPKFAITPKFTKKGLQQKLQTEIAVLAYGIRWKAAGERTGTGIGGTFDPIKSECPFKIRRKAPPRDIDPAERSIKGFITDMERIMRTAGKWQNPKPNISHADRHALKELREREDIVVTRSDKGGEMVIMKAEDMQELCREHLADSTTYCKLQKDPTPTLRLTINKALEKILRSRDFPKIIIRRLNTPPCARTQRFYALPKTHKKSLKIRPIVSGSGGIFERLGWILHFIFKPLLLNVSAHISSTRDLIAQFTSNENKLKKKIPISFDVISLYTNIGIEEGISTVLEYANRFKINTYSLTPVDLKELLGLILYNNVFQHPTLGTFKQTRGLAMGSRLSGTIAIIVMDRFEQRHIYRNISPPLPVFVRYVDDSGTAVDTPAEAQSLLTKLNGKHPTIKFELELPDKDGFLPILDIRLKILPNGKVTHKLYVKEANKGITLHADSHHPTAVKMAVINNEYKRAQDNSTPEFAEEARRFISDKLAGNGYSAEHIIKARARRRNTSKQTKGKQLVFRIPYISDKVNGQVRQALKKNGITARLVNPRPPTIQELTKKKGEPEKCRMRECPMFRKKCTCRFAVYEATCHLCHERYVGSTGRQVHTRAQEHTNAAKSHDKKSAFGVHYAREHPNATPEIMYEIAQLTERDELRLRIREAYAIRDKKPTINRRKEDMGTGFLA
ncbi:uncharacterized protein LOC135810995 [Sycon ciliatum]|uniref:uncharacterized protein LOC135810995 n=1 Tax=Sycon ciliatum TaxID=27933 RepID=UPI0031F6C7B4